MMTDLLPVSATPGGSLLMAALAGYLLGSIPFGILVTRAMSLGDLRRVGSGNIGATNVLRTGNKRAAAATLILDGAKGSLAVLVARWWGAEDAAQLAGLMAVLGHMFPVWLGFRGGKGVATVIGVLLALAWPAGVAVCATWLAAAALFRISSLAAMVAIALSAPWLTVFGQSQAVALALALTALVIWRHSANIARLRAGTEPRIGAKG